MFRNLQRLLGFYAKCSSMCFRVFVLGPCLSHLCFTCSGPRPLRPFPFSRRYLVIKPVPLTCAYPATHPLYTGFSLHIICSACRWKTWWILSYEWYQLCFVFLAEFPCLVLSAFPCLAMFVAMAARPSPSTAVFIQLIFCQ